MVFNAIKYCTHFTFADAVRLCMDKPVQCISSANYKSLLDQLRPKQRSGQGIVIESVHKVLLGLIRDATGKKESELSTLVLKHHYIRSNGGYFTEARPK